MDKDMFEEFPNQKKRQKDFKCSIGFAMTVIGRIAYAEIPPKVEYVPTDRGKSLENILTELCLWGKKYMNFY